MQPTLSYPSTKIYIDQDLLQKKFLKDFLQIGKRKGVIIADQAIKELYGDPLAKLLEVDLLTVPGGEDAKNYETKLLIEQKLFEGGYSRDTAIIALGGGATTDVAGFIASTYLRGVPFISIPTTLLAMIDASIGGKTAINTSFGKNLLGTFYHPEIILIDTRVLSSLPEKQWMNGLAESLKMGLISDSFLWDLLEKNYSNGLYFLNDPSLIVRVIEDKMNIVNKDPKEFGIRRILNFGHTIGHGLEALSSYEMSHGEAVALGCVVEAFLSKELRYLQEKDFERIFSVYASLPLCLPKNYTREALLKAFLHDKKRYLEKVRFVLLDRVGHALPFEGAYCRPVSNEELASTLNWMEITYG
jgi:3-dehydroquinate synthase